MHCAPYNCPETGLSKRSYLGSGLHEMEVSEIFVLFTYPCVMESSVHRVGYKNLVGTFRSNFEISEINCAPYTCPETGLSKRTFSSDMVLSLVSKEERLLNS